MSYEKYYPGGWQSGESGGTPITPEALNHIENGIKQTYSDFAPAQEDASFPGCYYRMVNGIKEWINPPMVPGVEYRTTERYNGNVVYTQTIDCGYLPKNTYKSVYLSNKNTIVLDYKAIVIWEENPAYLYNWVVPMRKLHSQTQDVVEVQVVNEAVHLYTNYDYNGEPHTQVTIKYYKR